MIGRDKWNWFWAGACAVIALLLAVKAFGMVAGVPAPGTASGILGLPYTIWKAGPFLVVDGQVLVGMSHQDGTHFHFKTDGNPFQIWWMFCQTSMSNDKAGARAHTVAITWYRQSLGNLPSGSPWPGPYDLPRPGAVGDPDITGGQTVTNAWGDNLKPYAGLIAQGYIYGTGWLPESRGGVAVNTTYNGDLIVQAVLGGNAYVLGTTCQAIKVR